jgi:hypothetical protein
MATQLAQIVGAMVTALVANGPTLDLNLTTQFYQQWALPAFSEATPVSGQIYRARLRPLAAQHTDAVVVRVLSSTPARAAIQGGPMDWESVIAVECYARSATSTPPDLALDALWAAVYARLMANSLLGGLLQAELNCTQAAYDFDIDGEHTACLTSTWQAAHRTTNNSVE